MSGRRAGRRLAAVAVVVSLVASVGSTRAAFGQQTPSGSASITVDRNTVHPGDHVVVQFHNWKAHSVTVSLCGNLARRGSSDCDIVGSQGVPISQFSPETLTDFVVPMPPTTCPCVLRASDSTQTEIAYTSIVLIGVSTGPVVGPSDVSPIDVTLRVRRSHQGVGAALRSALGGPTPYDVSLVLLNKSAETLTDVRPYGFAGSSKTDQARTLNFPPIGQLGPGQSWTHTLRVRTPAPHLGRFYWEISVSGAGPPVHAESVTRDTPWLLLALVLLIVADVVVMAVRRVRRRTREAADVPELAADVDTQPVAASSA